MIYVYTSTGFQPAPIRVKSNEVWEVATVLEKTSGDWILVQSPETHSWYTYFFPVTTDT